MESLADLLGVRDPVQAEESSDQRAESTEVYDPNMSAQEFALKVLSSPDFRRYIVNGLFLGELPSAIVVRLMDYGWGKPPERIEHTGKNGEAIVTEVRRVVVRAPADSFEERFKEPPSAVTH